MDTKDLRDAVHDAISRALDEGGVLNDVLRGMCLEVGIEKFQDALAAQPAASGEAPPSLTHELQQRCSDWGTYWREPDAHGVNLTIEQATELLHTALCVEVEIAAPTPAQPTPEPLPLDTADQQEYAARVMLRTAGQPAATALPGEPVAQDYYDLCVALLSYKQADVDGVFVLVSREACEKAAEALSAHPPVPAEPVAPWEDPRVQAVYALLCSDEVPPKDHHWEGWTAQRIVDALAAHPPVAPLTDARIAALARSLEPCLDEEYLRRGDWLPHAIEFARAIESALRAPSQPTEEAK